MCVIIHGLRKKHVRRAEVQEAMKHNDSGFFMMILTGKTPKDRKSIRTLDEKEALDFFDKAPDDAEFVMHARIPSYGPKTLDNVHGWEEDGIVFMHNMSLRSIDGFRDKFPDWKDRTDSEFFFRKLFIPYYRGLGEEAYKDGKLHPDLEKFVNWICGSYNKFLFVMPDNRVLRFGIWVRESDRKENGECAFYASNSSYQVVERTWPNYGGTAQSAGSFRQPCDCNAWEFDGYGAYVERHDKPAPSKSSEPDGKTLRKLVGDAEVAKIALMDMVLGNVLEARAILQVPGEKEAAEELGSWVPSSISNMYGTYSDGFNDAFEWLLPEAQCGDDSPVGLFLDSYAADLERSILKTENRGLSPYYVDEDTLKKGIETLYDELDTFCRLANISFDWSADAKSFAYAFYMSRTRTGKPKMDQFESIDLIGGEDVNYVDASNAVDRLLKFIRKAKEDAK